MHVYEMPPLPSPFEYLMVAIAVDKGRLVDDPDYMRRVQESAAEEVAMQAERLGRMSA